VRLAFAGTPAFAAAALKSLHQAGHELVLVLTQPDRPAGRGLKLQASPVKQLALELGLPVAQPRSLRLDGRWPDDARQAQARLLAAHPQLMVVAAYGLILPRWVLQLPEAGCINIHGSLLPRWRGAAPIQRAIEAGDTQTGITIMQMDEGLDTGDMLLAEAQPIRGDDTTASLHDRLAQQGARLIVQALRDLQAGTLQRRAQPAEGVSYARKIDKSEAAIAWSEPAQRLERRIRAFDPFPGANFALEGQSIKLWRARSAPAGSGPAATPGTVLRVNPGAPDGALLVACGDGALELLEMQAPGGRRVSAQAFLASAAGRDLTMGQVLPQTAD
jgi:methionyl-tRNA formyltransferase